MIAQLKGTVSSREGYIIYIDVQGVTYEIMCSRWLSERLETGKSYDVIVYTDYKETAVTLYGFDDRLEKKVFLLLKEVNGVGSKSASDIVSKIDKSELLRIIGNEDLHRLQSIKGIGKKTAERIVVELRDKVKKFALEQREISVEKIVTNQSAADVYYDAVQALVALGIHKRNAEQAIVSVKEKIKDSSQKFPDSGEIVKEALKYI
jgi:holliday junction DNA helicase RuvA